MDPTVEPNLDTTKSTDSITPAPAPTSTPTTTSTPTPTPTITTAVTPPAQPTTTNPDYAFPPAGAPEPEPAPTPSTGPVPMGVVGAPDALGTNTLDSSSNSLNSTNQPNPTTPIPEYIPDAKPKKKIFKVLIPVVLVVLILAVGGLLFLKSQATSTAALKEFSSATSTLSSESSAISSSISSSASSTEEDSTIEEDIKEFDEALANFEAKTANLKSDRKALKAAAENYIKELKSYRANSVVLALDVTKISAITYKLGVVLGMSFVELGSTQDYAGEVSKVTIELDKHSEDLKALELSNESAKEYRDKSVELVASIKEIYVGIKTAADAGNGSSAVLAAQTSLRGLVTSGPAIEKEDEIVKELGYDSDATKKVEDARKALNDEITKVNKGR